MVSTTVTKHSNLTVRTIYPKNVIEHLETWILPSDIRSRSFWNIYQNLEVIHYKTFIILKPLCVTYQNLEFLQHFLSKHINLSFLFHNSRFLVCEKRQCRYIYLRNNHNLQSIHIVFTRFPNTVLFLLFRALRHHLIKLTYALILGIKHI